MVDTMKSNFRQYLSKAILIITVVLMGIIFIYWFAKIPQNNNSIPPQQDIGKIFWYYFQPMLYWIGAIILESATIIVGYALSTWIEIGGSFKEFVIGVINQKV